MTRDDFMLVMRVRKERDALPQRVASTRVPSEQDARSAPDSAPPPSGAAPGVNGPTKAPGAPSSKPAAPPGSAPESTGPSDSGAPLQCVWFWGCLEPPVRGGLCEYHAGICRDEIAEYEYYATDHEDGWTDG